MLSKNVKIPSMPPPAQALRRYFERFVPSVNDHSATFNIFPKFYEKGRRISFRVAILVITPILWNRFIFSEGHYQKPIKFCEEIMKLLVNNSYNQNLSTDISVLSTLWRHNDIVQMHYGFAAIVCLLGTNCKNRISISVVFNFVSKL